MARNKLALFGRFPHFKLILSLALLFSLGLAVIAANTKTNLQQHASTCGIEGAQCITQGCCSGYSCIYGSNLLTFPVKTGYYCHKNMATPTPPQYNPCSGTRLLGGVCGNGRLYMCDGRGNLVGSADCPFGCQVNRNQQDKCITSPPTATPAPYRPLATPTPYRPLPTPIPPRSANPTPTPPPGTRCKTAGGSCIGSRVCFSGNDLKSIGTYDCLSGTVCCKSL